MDDIAVKVAEIDQRSKSNTHRLDKVEERLDKQDELIRGLGVLSAKVENVETDVSEMKADVKTLTEKPSKRWDELVKTLIGIVVGALMALALSKVGLT